MVVGSGGGGSFRHPVYLAVLKICNLISLWALAWAAEGWIETECYKQLKLSTATAVYIFHTVFFAQLMQLKHNCGVVWCGVVRDNVHNRNSISTAECFLANTWARTRTNIWGQHHSPWMDEERKKKKKYSMEIIDGAYSGHFVSNTCFHFSSLYVKTLTFSVADQQQHVQE